MVQYNSREMNMKPLSLLVPLLLTLMSTACKTYHHPKQVRVENYNMDVKSRPPDSSMIALIQPYKNQMAEALDKELGICEQTLSLDRPESPLGNFLGDALHKKSQDYYKDSIDFAALNYGGVRLNEITAGPITKRKIYELMPFENRIAILELDSASVHYLANHIAKREGWPTSASLRFEILFHKAVSIKINGKPLRNDRNYRIALPDYIANGGDKCVIPSIIKRTDLKELVREAFFEYIAEFTNEGLKVDSKIDGRIVFLFE